jgi:hypothetical protein
VALLTAVAANFKNGESIDANLNQGVFYRIELGGLNHCFKFGHYELSLRAAGARTGKISTLKG